MNKLLKMQVRTDLGTTSFRDYLKGLLHKLWREGEGFSGKRPFGNGGWQFSIYEAMIKNGFVEGTLDEHDYVEKLDREQADQLILRAIEEM